MRPLFDLSDPRIQSAVTSVVLFQAAPHRMGLGSPFPSPLSWCRLSPSPARTIILASFQMASPSPTCVLLSPAHTPTLTRRILLKWALYRIILRPRVSFGSSLSNEPHRCSVAWVNRNGGRTCDASVGHSRCLRHFAVHWPQTQLVTNPIQFCILNVSATLLSLPQLRPSSNLDDSQSLPIGHHITKLVSLLSSPLHCS